jgi:hypothetical protein
VVPRPLQYPIAAILDTINIILDLVLKSKGPKYGYKRTCGGSET